MSEPEEIKLAWFFKADILAVCWQFCPAMVSIITLFFCIDFVEILPNSKETAEG